MCHPSLKLRTVYLHANKTHILLIMRSKTTYLKVHDRSKLWWYNLNQFTMMLWPFVRVKYRIVAKESPYPCIVARPNGQRRLNIKHMISALQRFL